MVEAVDSVGSQGTRVNAVRAEVLQAYLARQARNVTVAPPEAPPQRRPDIGQAAALAAGRAAEAAAGLVLRSKSTVAGTCSLAELIETLPENPLIAMIEADRDRLGVLALSPGMLASLIEMQTFGRVTEAAPEARRSTRADAALAADFINAMLAGLGAEAMRIQGAEAFVGFRYASHLDDPHPLGLVLEDQGFRSLRLDLALGSAGQRSGEIFVAVPLNEGQDHPVNPPRSDEDDQHDGGPALAAGSDMVAPAERPTGKQAALPRPADRPRPDNRSNMADAMQNAPIPLIAVLCRRRATLSELRNLLPGAMLALPRHALGEAQLETTRGEVLASGKLGEIDGFHALRLHDQAATPGAASATARPGLRDPLMPHPLPVEDLEQPDDFRPHDPDSPAAVQNWRQALADEPGHG